MDPFPVPIETLLEGKSTSAYWTLEPVIAILSIIIVVTLKSCMYE